ELCRDPDFTDLDFYPVGTYSQIGGATVGIGCNEERVCRVSLNGSFSLVSSGHTLRERAEERGSGSELRPSMQDILGSQEYAQAVQDQLDIRDCYASNEASFLNEGEVTTCDGQTRVALAGGPATAASCTPERVCTEQITTTQTFTTSCTRTFGSLTTNRCTVEYKTLECVNYDGWELVPREYWVNDCKTSDLEGATEVARSKNTCRLWLHLSFFGSLCPLWGADTSYVFFDEFEYTDCEAFPAPLPEDKPWQEACDMSTSSREILSCAVGGWFGRTLPDS